MPRRPTVFILKCRQCETKRFFCDVIKDIYDWSVVQTTDLKDDVYLYNNDVYLYNNVTKVLPFILIWTQQMDRCIVYLSESLEFYSF
jgi:hypothetical protein